MWKSFAQNAQKNDKLQFFQWNISAPTKFWTGTKKFCQSNRKKFVQILIDSKSKDHWMKSTRKASTQVKRSFEKTAKFFYTFYDFFLPNHQIKLQNFISWQTKSFKVFIWVRRMQFCVYCLNNSVGSAKAFCWNFGKNVKLSSFKQFWPPTYCPRSKNWTLWIACRKKIDEGLEISCSKSEKLREFLIQHFCLSNFFSGKVQRKVKSTSGTFTSEVWKSLTQSAQKTIKF